MQLITKETLNKGVRNCYMQTDMEIFYADYLKDSDRRVYSELRNKLNLSIENGDKYCTKDGEYYIYYSQEKLSERLGYSVRTISSAFKTLSGKTDKHEPFIRLDREESNTYRIYFYNIVSSYGTYTKRSESVNDSEAPTPTTKPETPSIPEENTIPTVVETPIEVLLGQAEMQVALEQEKFSYANVVYSSDNATFTGVDANFACEDESFASRKKETVLRKTYKEKDNKNKDNKSIYLSSKKEEMDRQDLHYKQIIADIKEQIEYDALMEETIYTGIAEEFFMCVVDMLTSKQSYVNREFKPLAVIESVLKNLTKFHMETVIEAFVAIKFKIGNVPAYMKSMVYNACKSANAGVKNIVMNNMYGNGGNENTNNADTSSTGSYVDVPNNDSTSPIDAYDVASMDYASFADKIWQLGIA